jgi:hypothetical protein
MTRNATSPLPLTSIKKREEKKDVLGRHLKKKRESNAASNKIIRKAAFFFSYACVRVCLIRLRGFFFSEDLQRKSNKKWFISVRVMLWLM